MGGHGLPAHRHGRDAALRQARRHLRPPSADADCDCAVRPRLGRLRNGDQHDDAGARPRAAGPRWWRVDGAGANHHRRHRIAAGAGAVPGLHRRRIRNELDRRAGGRRLPHRASRLVADLLDQPAARACRARHDLRRAQARAVHAGEAPARLSRRAFDDRRRGRAAVRPVTGWRALRMDLAADRRPRRGLRHLLGPVHLASHRRPRAVPAAQCARQSDRALLDLGRRLLHGGSGRA